MPKAPKTKNLAGLFKFFIISAAVLGLSSCGGGGGSAGGSDEPAPLTLNGVVFTIYESQGPVLTMIQASGDAMGSGEMGSVRMAPNPPAIDTVGTGGARSTIAVSPTISGATYLYTRTSPEGGRLVISGEGVTQSPGNNPVLYEYFGGEFSRTYDMVFATDGRVVTAVLTQDYSTQGGISTAISSQNGSMKVVGSSFLPNSWSLEQSAGVILPKLYPETISGEALILTIAGDPETVQDFDFVRSSYTRLTEAEGGFLEGGAGNVFIDGDPTPKIVNYFYTPVPKSTNQVKLTIAIEGLGRTVFTLTFVGSETGTFVDSQGRVGIFAFPFLD